jgi:hypothetical protein
MIEQHNWAIMDACAAAICPPPVGRTFKENSDAASLSK